MPFPREHSARLKSPDQFKRFRRQNDKFASGIDAIWGIKIKDGKEVVELQAIRFDKEKFTVGQARKWLKDNNIKFISFEPAGK